MSRIEKTITMDAPIDVVYGQWTQFESFPTVHGGRRQGRPGGRPDARLDGVRWPAGRRPGRPASLDQTPHDRIAWKSIDGPQNDGAVTFTSADLAGTEIRLVVDADPEGIVEQVGDRLGLLDRRIGGDLDVQGRSSRVAACRPGPGRERSMATI